MRGDASRRVRGDVSRRVRGDVSRRVRGDVSRRVRGDVSGLVAPAATEADAAATAPQRPPGWWDLLPFTTHRIGLAPGLDTMSAGVDVEADIRCDLVVDACGGSLDEKSVVDLGCLEGGFTIAFAARGARLALGIEAREISVRRCELARGLRRLPNAEFVRGDIKAELDRREPFDVVFATGILYHVSDPAAILASMRQACSHVALVCTHVAVTDAPSHSCSDEVVREFAGHSYRGRMYPEYSPTVDDAEKEDLLWAAWSDADAFWPYEDGLVDMIRRAGFATVEKVDMTTPERAERWGVDPINRVLYLAYV